jgi:hypothetical protein
MVDRVLRALSSARGKRIKVVAAFWAVPATLLAWGVSAFTWAREEPQFVLGLSWLAITLTAIDILTTAQVHEENGDGNDDASGDPDGR